MREVLIRLGLRGLGANYSHIRKHMERLQIDPSGLSGNREKDFGSPFVHGKVVSGKKLRRHLRKDSDVPYRCFRCGNPGEWLGEPLTLQVDHVNGDRTNSSKENLRWLCPNCHAQTETYARGRIPEIFDLTCPTCRSPFRRSKHRMSKGVNYCSRQCSSKGFGNLAKGHRPRSPRPGSRKIPHELVRETHAKLRSFRATGMELGISDVAVKKIVMGSGWSKGPSSGR